MMSFMGSSGKGINEQEVVEEGEEEEEEQMMMRRESGKLPISFLSSSSTSHLQHTGVVVGNWLENKHSDDQKKQDDDESNEVVRQGGGGGGGDSGVVVQREHMFDKVVTPSDVGKLNRLVIPKQHAEKYFPLDSSTTNSNDINKGLLLNFEDPNGKPWRFRYSYWNSSQSYVMTKGWSRFVKDKKLDAGDIVSFHRGLGDLFKHRLFIDWRRRPHATTTSTTLDVQAPHTSLLHHPPGPSLSFPPHYFSFSGGRSNIQQQYHLPYPWSSSSGGLLLHPPPPHPHTHTHTQGVAAMSSRDRHDSHSQYLTMQPSNNIHHHPHPYYNASNYGYMTSSNLVNNIINPTYSGGPVMYLRSATAAQAVPAGSQQQEGMMMMQMPRGGPDDEEGGVLLEPFVFDSVLPVVVQGKAAAAKRLRLFGVNMEYSPVEEEEEQEQEESHHHKPPPPP